MTAEERIERACTLKVSSLSATAGLVFVSRAAPPLLIHTQYRVCVCVCVCVCGLCPGSSEITRLQLPCVTNADSTAVIPPSSRHHLKFFKQRWRGQAHVSQFNIMHIYILSCSLTLSLSHTYFLPPIVHHMLWLAVFISSADCCFYNSNLFVVDELAGI